MFDAAAVFVIRGISLYFLFLFIIIFIAGSHAFAKECGSPAVPVNAKVSVERSTHDTIASYVCDDGYELFGADRLECSDGRWNGELPFCGINVAVRRPTNQSTTIRGGLAGNANDGEKTTVHDGKRCTETGKESSPWWQVDLLKPYPVRVVRVTTRGCCGHQPLQDLEIRVGNSSAELQRNPLCAWFPGSIEEGTTKTFTCARTLVGQHVFLQMVGIEGSLSLCEVEVFTTDEFSNDLCAPLGVSNEGEWTSFNRICYEFNIAKGGSFEEARNKCRANGGDMVHGFKGSTTTFLLGELERRKDRLKTQLVWIGAQKEPGFTSRTWKWVNGDVVSKPSWGKDQPNNYNGEQNCVVIDGGRNWLWNDVGCNLDYLPWICENRPAFCGSPDKHTNTTFEIKEGKKIGSVIEYKCPEGFKLVGDKKRTCTEGGFWSGQAPTCEFVDCGMLPDIEHGSLTLNDDRTTFGAKITFECQANYSLIGQSERRCGEDSIWSGQQPQCLFDWCPDPPRIQGGSVNVSGKRTGSLATYTCQSGYILFGQKELMCGIGGEWSGKTPTCKYVDCGPPPNVDNGQYILLNDSTTHGAIVEYSCGEDYWLEPQNNRRQMCTRDGTWSGQAPTCELITCGEPEVPPGGYVVGYDFNVKSKIEFHCDAGHMLKGVAVSECTTQGEWTSTPPKCEYIDCGKLTPPLYGTLSYVNSTTYLDSEVMYSCSRNYRIHGSPMRRCLANHTWSGIPAKCEEIRCPEPTVPEHSIISVTGNDRVYGRTLIRTTSDSASISTYKIAALVKYRCERGYKIVGDPISTCEDNGRWTGDVPTCVFVDCGMPPSIERGHFMLASNVTYYGAVVLYECQDNYELDGYARRMCLENGTWSAETPVCKEILCGNPEVGESMTVNVTMRSIGGIARYSCAKGLRMEESMDTRECLGRGIWSGSVPTCIPIECEMPKLVENGRIIAVNQSTSYNSAIEYHCVPKYQRVGPYLRKCMEDGRWSGEDPKCELMTPSDSEAQISHSVSVGASIVLFLLILIGIVYLKLKKAKPVKNTENIQGAIKKEEEDAAAMSYASLSDGNGSNIYEKIPGMGMSESMLYDSPYEGLSHYEPSPIPVRRTNGSGGGVTINGVSVR